MPNETLNAALLYASMGLSVIPLHGKIPYFNSWQDVATTDPDTIQRWFQQQPDSNLGIATGKKSNVFVVDIDPRHGGDDTWADQKLAHKIPDTWQDITGGGGLHVWFRYPNFSVKSCAGILPGIDIRGDGGQVVAPPSIHPDTHKAYEWDGLRPIQEQPIAEAPGWLLNLLAPKPSEQKTHLEVPMRIPHGVQHYALLSLAGNLRRMGLEYAEILATLSSVNERRCEQPGPQKNIEQMARSVMRYAPGDKNIISTANHLWRLTAQLRNETDQQLEAMCPKDAYALMANPPKEVKLIVEDCLHVGCTILAGPPKCGKSYLALGLGINVATGGKFLGARDILRPGRVAYWALEESATRTAKRLRQLIETPTINLQNLEFMYALKPMFSGGLSDISAYCEKYRPDVIVIDTLMAFVTGDKGSRRDVFRDDYREIKALSDLAAKYDCALIVVHHTNKLGGDGIGAVAGSHGVTAAADCIWVMERQPQRRATLRMTGREAEDQAFLIELELQRPIGWTLIEQGEDTIMTEERQHILMLLRESGPKSPKQLSVEIGKNGMATRQLLYRMSGKGLILRDRNGSYIISNDTKCNRNQYDD
jgi:hypothetical protein